MARMKTTLRRTSSRPRNLELRHNASARRSRRNTRRSAQDSSAPIRTQATRAQATRRRLQNPGGTTVGEAEAEDAAAMAVDNSNSRLRRHSSRNTSNITRQRRRLGDLIAGRVAQGRSLTLTTLRGRTTFPWQGRMMGRRLGGTRQKPSWMGKLYEDQKDQMEVDGEASTSGREEEASMVDLIESTSGLNI